MNNLAFTYQAVRKLDPALPLLEETLKLRKAKLGPEHPDTLNSMGNLAIALDAAGKHSEAVRLCHEALAIQRRKLPADDPVLTASLSYLGLFQLHADQPEEAEPLLRECVALRQKIRPDDWATFNVQSALGGALLGQKKYADAEPLLLAGNEGMKQRADKIPPQGKIRLTEALERLIKLAEETNKPDDVTKWKAERAKYPDPAAKPRKEIPPVVK